MQIQIYISIYMLPTHIYIFYSKYFERAKGYDEVIINCFNAVVALPAINQFENLTVSRMPIVLLSQADASSVNKPFP